MDKETRNQKIHKAFIDFKGDKGRDVFKKIIRTKIDFENYQENHNELRETIKKIDKKPDDFFRKNTQERWDLQAELGRRINNTVISADIFVDRKQGNNEKKSEFMVFMGQLRNFIIHTEIVNIITKITTDFDPENEGKKRKFRYNTFQQEDFHTDLEKQFGRTGINKTTRKNINIALHYLEGMRGDIHLDSLTLLYYKEVYTLYRDRLRRRVSLHRKQLQTFLDEVELLHSKLRELDVITDHPLSEPHKEYLRELLREFGK